MHDTLKAETLATLSQAQNVGNSRRIINWRRAITQWWPQALLDRSSCFFFFVRCLSWNIGRGNELKVEPSNKLMTSPHTPRNLLMGRLSSQRVIFMSTSFHLIRNAECSNNFPMTKRFNSQCQTLPVLQHGRSGKNCFGSVAGLSFFGWQPTSSAAAKGRTLKGKTPFENFCFIIRKVPYPPDNSFTCVFNMFASVKLLCWSIYLLVNLILYLVV